MLLMAFNGERLSAQQITTMGTDFWVSGITHDLSGEDTSKVSIGVAVATPDDSCQITFSFPFTDWDTTITITPSCPELSNGFFVNGLTIYDYQVRPRTSELIHNHSFHITSTSNIALFAHVSTMAIWNAIRDVTLVLPTNALDSNYVIQTMPSTVEGAEFNIVATEDNTTVHILPTCATNTGRPAGVPFSITIPEAGQCLQIISADTGDFSGTRVWADAGKRIAVFQGNGNAKITPPSYPPNNDQGGIVYEQAIPVKYWGRHFLVPHSALSYNMPDYIRVLADSSCTVMINGTPHHLDAGESYSYFTDVDDATDYIVADKRVSVALLNCPKWTSTTSYIYTSMVNITPWEQRTSDCHFHTTWWGIYNYPPVYSDIWLHIVTKTADTSALTLDGSNTGLYFTPVAANPQFSHAKTTINQARQYHLHSDSPDGFTAYTVTKRYTSGAYTAGGTLSETSYLCINDTTYTDTIYGCDSLLYEGITYYDDDAVPYNILLNAAGCDSILMHAIVIKHSYHKTEEVYIRDTATFTWIDGNTYTESTDEPFVVLQAHNGCDSTVHLHLTVLPTPRPQPLDSTAIWVPNVFTPDEDINSQFKIFCNDIISAEVSVFNRWGLHICTFDGLTESWDGTMKGTACPQGTYVYIIEYTSRTRPQYTKRKIGTVTLVR